MTEVKPGGGFPRAEKPYDPADVIPGSTIRTYTYGATDMAKAKKPVNTTKYRIAHDIVISAGMEAVVEPAGTNVRYDTEHVSVKLAVTPDITAEWAMDLEEALSQGLIEEVPSAGGDAA